MNVADQESQQNLVVNTGITFNPVRNASLPNKENLKPKFTLCENKYAKKYIIW